MNEPKSERWWAKEFKEKFGTLRFRGVANSAIEAFIDMVASRTRTDALKEAAGVAGTFKAPDFVEDLEDFKTYLEAAILSLIKEDER